MACLRLFGFAILCVLTFSLTGCSNDSSSGGGGEQRKLSPTERWPETGSYRYDFSDSVNGSSCRANNFFGRKSDYCVTLTDREKNRDCALDARRATYTKNCGDDFEETNIRGQDWFGWDNRLDTSCSTPHTFDNFETLSSYCGFLKDEATHKNCHWDDRKQAFAQNRCVGAFSPEPPFQGATPTPSPTPDLNPSPTPEPTPTPDLRPQVARDLEAAGIKIDIDYNSRIPVMPGEPSFDMKLSKFWITLENVKGSLIARKAVLNSLILTSYTAYHNQGQYLAMDVALNETEVLSYLNLLDRRLNLQQKLGVPLDLGVEVYGFEKGDKMAELKKTLQIFEDASSSLMKIRSTIKTLSVDSFFHYSFFDSELSLKREQIAADLQKGIKLLTPLTDFYDFAQVQGIKIEAVISMDLEIDGAAIAGLTKKLMSAKKAMTELVSLGKFKEASLSTMRTETNYYESTQVLTPASAGPALDALPDQLGSLADCFSLADLIHADFDTRGYRLDSDLVKAAKRFQKYFSSIKGKGALITSVTYSDRSEYSYKRLTIGTQDSDDSFEKILKGIK